MTINYADKYEIVNNIMHIFDNCFMPNISCRVKNLDEYSKKIFNFASTYYIRENDMIIGFCSFYCNDYDNAIGYLTQIAVLPDYNGRGFGKVLLNKCIDECTMSGMKKLKLEVYKENLKAIKFYKNNGFENIEENAESNYMMMDLKKR